MLCVRRSVTLGLMLLIGGYGASHAQVTEREAGTREQAARQAAETGTKMEEATKDFLGLKWGLGIGVIGGVGGSTAVEKASLVGTEKVVRVDEEGDMRPQMFLEMHVFLGGGRGKVKGWREYEQKKAQYKMAQANGEQGQTPPKAQEYSAPLRGVGPFIALQGGDKDVINALAVGVMWGFRRDPEKSNSVNVGIGISFDPSVQVLGDGVKEGKPLPAGESAVRFKKEGQFGWAVMASFTF
jgi:hypothetical protein